MATYNESGGSPFLQEIWNEKFGLGGDEFGVSITIPRDDVPWSARLDSKTQRILAELFLTLGAAERRKLARLLRESAENSTTSQSRTCRFCGRVRRKPRNVQERLEVIFQYVLLAIVAASSFIGIRVILDALLKK